MAQNRPDLLTAQKGNIQFDTHQFFSKLKDSVTSAFNTEFGSAGRSAFEAIAQTDDSENAQLYNIIWQAAGTACSRIIKDKFKSDKFSDLGSDAFVFRQDLGRQLETLNFTIDKTFFSEPQSHPQVLVLRDVFANWMHDVLDISTANANAAAAPFPRFFLSALAETDKKAFDKIKAYFDHPIYEALNRMCMQEAYHASLLQQYDSPAFGNNPRISLSDLYVEPNVTFFRQHIPLTNGQNPDFIESCHPKDVEKKDSGFKQPIGPLSIHAFFEAWLSNKCELGIKNGNSATMLLLGQPGQGKTSFCLRTMHNKLSNNDEGRIFFMRLRDLEGAPTELIEKPLDYLKGEFSKRVWNGEQKMRDKDWQGGLLILDGLDELYMNKNMSNEQVRQFLDNVQLSIKKLRDYTTPIHLKCVVTSRHNYVPLERHENNNSDWLITSLDNLNLTQQQSWLRQYKGFITDEPVKEYLNKLNDTLVELDKGDDKKSQEVRNLVNQPILLSMIAQSEIPLDLNTDRAKIYCMMFDTLQERSWAKEQISSLKLLKQSKKVQVAYRNFLQRLAIHIFQSKNEYVRRSDFDIKGTPLNTAFERLKKTFGDTPLSIEQVLSSFYFKQVVKEYDAKKGDFNTNDEHNNYAFEFLHKSLQEYLVAEGVWAYMKTLAKKNEDDEYQIDDKKAFEEMFLQFFAPRMLTNEVVEYLHELIFDEKNNKEDIEALKERLKELLPYLSKHSFLLKYDSHSKTELPKPFDQSLYMFYGFWSVISRVTTSFMPHQILILNDFSTNQILKKMDENRVYASVVNTLYLQNIVVNFIVNIRRLDRNCSLILSYQNFRGTNFRGVDLNNVSCIGVDFRASKFHGATLANAIFIGSRCTHADFTGINAYSTDFEMSEVSATTFQGSFLQGAFFRNAKLFNSFFGRSELRGANFQEAEFDSKEHKFFMNRFEGVIGLETSNFKGTIFENKIYKRADGSYGIEDYSEGESDFFNKLEEE
jgi:uncharacterized protein YjbI with pentapeptide repeats/GTPase SAR1 family protein